jgi:hypothetical protein
MGQRWDNETRRKIAPGNLTLAASPADPPVTRPARGMLIVAVEGAREEKSLKRRAAFASLIPNAIDGVLREESVRLRLELGINLELARRAATRLAGLDRMLNAGGGPVVIIAPPLLGEPARYLAAKPEEVEAAAAVWRAYRAALAVDVHAEAAQHLKFPDPPGAPSARRSHGDALGGEAAAGSGVNPPLPNFTGQRA